VLANRFYEKKNTLETLVAIILERNHPNPAEQRNEDLSSNKPGKTEVIIIFAVSNPHYSSQQFNLQQHSLPLKGAKMSSEVCAYC